MTDKEKLTELFEKIEYSSFPEMSVRANLKNQFTDYALNSIIDRLLSHGVTFEKQGEWEKYGYKWMCNKCRAKLNVDGTPESNGIYYCPECGARMKGEAK